MRARRCRGRVCGEGGAAARTLEVQLGAALADLLQRLSDRVNPNHASRPAERARLTATPCCAAAAPWPAQRNRIGGARANAPLAEAGHLAIRCVRRSTPCVHGRRYAEPQGGGYPRRGAHTERCRARSAAGAERCIDRRAREPPRREAVQSSVERRRAVEEERCCTARVAEWFGGASLRRCGAARVAMRKRGTKHSAVRQHGGCA